MQNLNQDARKARNEARNGRPQIEGAVESFGDSYSEIEDIRKDWKALKNDVAKLSKHAGSDSRKRLSNMSQKTMERLEAQITEKPAQTLAIAFFTGAAACLLLGRRR